MTNKEIILRFYETAFNNWDLSIVDEIMRDDYKQHSPEVEDGKEGFLKFFNGFLTQHPHAEIIHIMEDGDLVCVFFRCKLDGCTAKVFDLYRLEDGMLAEHWDCTMNTDVVPCVNPNGHF